MSPERVKPAASEPFTITNGQGDPGLAGDRTALAWRRSALSMVGTAVLVGRAGFTAHLEAVGLITGLIMTLVAWFTWLYGHTIYQERRLSTVHTHHQSTALAILTAATMLTGAVAIALTVGSS